MDEKTPYLFDTFFIVLVDNIMEVKFTTLYKFLSISKPLRYSITQLFWWAPMHYLVALRGSGTAKSLHYWYY